MVEAALPLNPEESANSEPILHHSCIHLTELLDVETPFLKREIRRHRYFMWEKLRREISKEEAELDYLDKHMHSYGAGFREAYCTHVCQDRKGCEFVEDLLHDLNER